MLYYTITKWAWFKRQQAVQSMHVDSQSLSASRRKEEDATPVGNHGSRNSLRTENKASNRCSHERPHADTCRKRRISSSGLAIPSWIGRSLFPFPCCDFDFSTFFRSVPPVNGFDIGGQRIRTLVRLKEYVWWLAFRLAFRMRLFWQAPLLCLYCHFCVVWWVGWSAPLFCRHQRSRRHQVSWFHRWVTGASRGTRE